MVTDTVLWQAINAYKLDNADAAFPFSRRLARDNGWSHRRALSAIAEYKRFIYLICHAATIQPGTVLTPSEDVDEVWHLHLIYTQDYWDRFCDETLGRRIHHGPTKGGMAEGDKYLECYRRTLALYEQEFGPPPSAIWPDEATRFQPATIRRIDTSQTLCLPKRQVFLCLAVATSLGLAGCGLTARLASWAATRGALIWGALVFIAMVVLIANLRNNPARSRKKDSDRGCGSGCATNSGCGSGGHSGGDGGGSGCGGSGCGGSGCGGGGD